MQPGQLKKFGRVKPVALHIFLFQAPFGAPAGPGPPHGSPTYGARTLVDSQARVNKLTTGHQYSGERPLLKTSKKFMLD